MWVMSSPLTVYRKTKGQTVDAFAELLGVDRTTVWRWETGKVPVERLADIESVTGIPRAQLRPDIFGDAA
jgi:DNA-binding transcriptional regulator YdaS (Cro superfamily)